MALNQKIRLQIISALDDAGIKATAAQLDALQAKVSESAVQAQGLGKQFSSAFNPMEAIMAVAHGNVEGITKSMVQLGLAVKGVTVSIGTMTGVFGLITLAVAGVQKLISHFRSAREEADKAAKAAADNFAKRTEEATKALNAEYTNQVKAIEDVCKKKNAELDVNQKLIESEIRLAKAKAGASKEEIDAAIAESRTKNDAAKAANEVTMGGDVRSVREKYIKAQKGNLEAMGNQLASYERQATEKMAAKRKEIENGILNNRYQNVLHDFSSEDGKEYLRRRVNREMGKWTKENGDQLYTKEINALVTSINAADKSIKETERAIADAERQKAENEKLRLATVNLNEAEIIKREREERMKIEDDLHKQRLANLKSESSALQAQASAARSRAEKEFQLYKSGNAAAQIEAEKKDAEARKQLQKDASRYGGKWRIDELARLYGAGDEKKVSETLQEWRKNRSFTPEVEAMVRAAASDKNATTLEDRVSQIAENTKNLADKVDELLAMKGE